MGFGFFVSVLEIPAPWALAGLALIPIGIGSIYGPFWSYTCASQTGAAGAAAIALVTSIGNAGGMFGPMLIGVLKDRTGSYQASFVVLAIVAIAAAALMAWTMRPAATCAPIVGSLAHTEIK
jgi:ACS family tartrate transporter-like MFS transporter